MPHTCPGNTTRNRSCSAHGGDTAGIWNAFDAIQAVRYSHEWGNRVTTSDLEIFKDIKAKRLPAVCWVTPDAVNSDHPQELAGQ